MVGPRERKSHSWLDLGLTDFYADWRGKLVVSWPGGERTWWRRVHRNRLDVVAVLEDSALEAGMPRWDELKLSWQDLAVLPEGWKERLSQWRGIYYIHEASDDQWNRNSG